MYDNFVAETLYVLPTSQSLLACRTIVVVVGDRAGRRDRQRQQTHRRGWKNKTNKKRFPC